MKRKRERKKRVQDEEREDKRQEEGAREKRKEERGSKEAANLATFTTILVLLIIRFVGIPKRCRTSFLKYKRTFVIFLLKPNTCQHVMFLCKK